MEQQQQQLEQTNVATEVLLVIGTPGRLLALALSLDTTIALDLSQVGFFVLDEADRLLEGSLESEPEQQPSRQGGGRGGAGGGGFVRDIVRLACMMAGYGTDVDLDLGVGGHAAIASAAPLRLFLDPSTHPQTVMVSATWQHSAASATGAESGTGRETGRGTGEGERDG